MTDSVGVVIPAYRPDVELLTEYTDTLDSHLDSAEFRVELDAPTDAVRESLLDRPVTVNTVADRRGKGAAITAGFEALDTDILAFVDSDGSTPAAEFVRIVDTLDSRDVDLAVGSRRHPDATVETTQSPARQSLGDGFAWLARRLCTVQLADYQCGAKALTADAWEQVREHISEPGFAWDIELVALAGALDIGVREVPITWHDHPNSTVPPIRTSIQLARGLVRARHRAQRLEGNRLHTTIDDVSEGLSTLTRQSRCSRHNE